MGSSEVMHTDIRKRLPVDAPESGDEIEVAVEIPDHLLRCGVDAATDIGLIWCGRNRKSGGKTAALPKKALAAVTGRHCGGLQVFVSW